MSKKPEDYNQLFLGGEWREGKGGKIKVLNPWNGDLIMEINAASESDVNEAFSKAVKAQESWAEKTPSERSQIMQKIADDAKEHLDEIIAWLVKESGATQLKATLEAKGVLAILEQAVKMPFMVEGSILPSETPGKESYTIRKPKGVISLITPWNFPLHLTARSLAPALALGNAVIIKPASDTIVCGGLIFAKMCEKAGLPKGLLSVLPGGGSSIGAAVAGHKSSRLVSFTGSTAVGREVAKTALDSEVIKSLELELGGNGPLVVLDDADIDQAVKAAVWGKFFHSGQICMAINRIIVCESVFDEFEEKFIHQVKLLKRIKADKLDTFIGPIINEEQLESVEKIITEAKEEGSRLVYSGDTQGLHMHPHIFSDVNEKSVLMQNEVFGPVATLYKATDKEEALRVANSTNYGLSAAVFSKNLSVAKEFASKIEAGMVHINDQPVNDSLFAPFGGVKNSGLGRFNGRWIVEALTDLHWISLQTEKRKYPTSLKHLQN